jgi:hypothetical protein
MSRIFVNKCPYIYTYMHTYILYSLRPPWRTRWLGTAATGCWRSTHRTIDPRRPCARSSRRPAYATPSTAPSQRVQSKICMYCMYECMYICICIWTEKSSTSGSGKGSQPRPNCIILDEVDGISEGGKVSTTTIHKKHTYIYVN